MTQTLEVARRLQMIRNPAMHGQLGDAGVEASFYGLLIAMFNHGERV